MQKEILVVVAAVAISWPTVAVKAGRCIDQVDRLAQGLALSVGAPRAEVTVERREADAGIPEWTRIIRRVKGPPSRLDTHAAAASGVAEEKPAETRLEPRHRLVVAAMLNEARAAGEGGHTLACYAQLNATRNALSAAPGANRAN